MTTSPGGRRSSSRSPASTGRRSATARRTTGFGLTEVYGWALGAVTTPAAQTYYVDNVALYGVAPVKPLTVAFGSISFPVTEGGLATVTVKLSKPSAGPVTVAYKSTIGAAIPNRDYVAPIGGTLTFAPNITVQTFTVQTIDDAKYEGERSLQVELSNPTGGAALGLPPVARVAVKDDEAYDAVSSRRLRDLPIFLEVRQDHRGGQSRNRGG